ncbi:DUF397 domain-containing protein [Nocardia asteroides]|uniref:DUF397 domain-containing protein n=1 Tax=Nocardia asteroides TaxID=1824 RepID=UPI001E4F1641|nr:DUF397 domain-containing protein [Nocardia asteroides]UGT59141.1 DUF397 domain-containing protein [Nocardia asteroides]
MSEPRWFKSSYSADQGNCVEVAYLPDGQLGVRDSKNPGVAALTFSRPSWVAFVAGMSAGEFQA